MDLTLRRLAFRKDGILGDLYSDNGSFLCSTLEHAYPINSSGFAPKIPLGFYRCVKGIHKLSHSPSFETFEVTDVPGHSGILFHTGNFNNDSEGCILVGEHDEYPDTKALILMDSRKTFEKFMLAQAQIKEFILTVVDYRVTDPLEA